MPAVSPVCYCALTTLAGTRFEPESLSGLAHFCEHMLFKGTIKRKSYHINNRLERLGGEINAFTTKEELVLHATVLREDIGKALELISDLVFNSVIPGEEMLKEREVILDEIRSYKDSPIDLIYDKFEERLFDGTPMATPILGTPGDLKKIRQEHILAYMKERFQPPYMVLSIVGHMSLNRAVELSEKYFGTGIRDRVFPGNAIRPNSSSVAPDFKNKCFEVEEKRNTYQIHCLTGNTAYGLHQEGRIPLILLMNILGGPASNARLNMLLREKYGLVYTVEASYTPYIDTGFAGIYFGTDRNRLGRCRELTDKVLAEYANKMMTGLQLDRAKKQLIGQLSISEDNPEVQCLSMGKSLLFFGKVLTPMQTVGMIAGVTPSQVMNAAADIWDPEKRSTLIYY